MFISYCFIVLKFEAKFLFVTQFLMSDEQIMGTINNKLRDAMFSLGEIRVLGIITKQ